MLHRPYFNGADAAILTFDVTRSSTFSNVNNWWQTCLKYGLGEIPRILVGIIKDEKCEQERKIILPMAEHLSEKLNAPYFEVSLHTGENGELVFQTIAELVYKCKEGENWMDFSKQLIKNHAPPVQESPTIQNEGKKTEEKRTQATSKKREVQSRESEKRPIELEMMREEERTVIPLGVFAKILDNRRHPSYPPIIHFPVYNVPNENRRHKEAVILSSLKKEKKKKKRKKEKKKKENENKSSNHWNR